MSHYAHPALLRGVLLGTRHAFSDVRLSRCPYRDLPFRRFRCLELGGGFPPVARCHAEGGRDRNGEVPKKDCGMGTPESFAAWLLAFSLH